MSSYLYNVHWKEEMLAEYSAGASDEEVAAALKMTTKRFKQYYTEDPVFKETVDMGRDWAKAFWLKKGRTSLEDKKFNSTLWYNNMKNRYGWAEKSEVKEEKGPTNPDELRKQVSDLLKRNGVPVKESV